MRPRSTSTHTCSRPLLLANLTSQPSRGWERRVEQERGMCSHWGLRESQEQLQPCEHDQSFIHSVQSKKRDIKLKRASLSVIYLVLFMGNKTAPSRRNPSWFRWKSKHISECLFLLRLTSSKAVEHRTSDGNYPAGPVSVWILGLTGWVFIKIGTRWLLGNCYHI